MRLDGRKTLPQGYDAMINLQKAVNQSKLDPKLLMLVVTRASQINGCAHCLDMHTKDALALGEDPQRLHVLAAWKEAPFYSKKERAALAWTESLTLVSQTGAPDNVYAELEKNFSPKEIMELTFAIVAINGWNRLAVGLRSEVGGYVSHLKAEPVMA
ncbi:MAG: carboxymuconolactone decarboxylase family protein [Chitinophagaceae bacterium]|nr:carboxymuconolactone decarboxylase family protein [Chitinophagaceae bacterium]